MKIRHISLLSTLALTAAAHAQSTSFTYQGRLKNGTAAASGAHDMRFKLFDAATGGTQVGSTQCLNNVALTEGLFSATIDFGPQFLTTAQRFLEIDVRADFGSPCTDVFGYVTLTRQLMTPAPRATAATVANALAAPDGSPATALMVDNSGNIGVGTTTPTHSVHVASPIPALALQDTDSTTDQVGFISYRDSANAERAWIGFGSAGDPDFSIINARPSGDIVLNTLGGGRVGIGTASPLSTLDVRGNIRFGSSGQYLATAADNNLRIIQGTVDPGSGCSDTPTTSGLGFTITVLSCAEIRVNFTTPFTGTPVVVASAEWDFNNGSRYVTCSDTTTSSVAMRVFFANGNNTRAKFRFMAVGPR